MTQYALVTRAVAMSHLRLSHGAARPTRQHNVIAYNNLTTPVSPLIAIMLTNRSIDNKIPDIEFVTQHLMYLRPKDVSIGSAQATNVPNAADMGQLGVKNALVSIATLFSVIAFVL
jgi:hypothetical protein